MPCLQLSDLTPANVPTNDRYLVNPSQFSQFGIEDDEFFMNRGKTELRSLFESIGHSFSPEVRAL